MHRAFPMTSWREQRNIDKPGMMGFAARVLRRRLASILILPGRGVTNNE